MKKSRKAQPARVQQMALLLIWEGYLSRSRLMDLYGLSPVRASEWIRELRTAYPRWTLWESRDKHYRATEAAYKAWRDQQADPADRDGGFARYLTDVGLRAAEVDLSVNGIWNAFRDFSTPSPKVFATLREAITRGLATEIVYRSMREPSPHQRLIEPHSLIRAGRRWHVRAHCLTNGDYRDYSLGRIVDVRRLERTAVHGAQDDAAWQTAVRVAITAHPDLAPEQADVVRFEYFQQTAARVEHCRAALVPYLLQDLRVAVDTRRQRPPEYQLAIANLEEVRLWLFPT